LWEIRGFYVSINVELEGNGVFYLGKAKKLNLMEVRKACYKKIGWKNGKNKNIK
jgi:hypothetical protein